MRILLDECLPKRLKRDLVGHEARTVPEMGWASKRNGDLLGLAETDFDVFLTVDRNLSFQQDVTQFKIAVVVMVAHAAYRDLDWVALRGRARGSEPALVDARRAIDAAAARTAGWRVGVVGVGVGAGAGGIVSRHERAPGA